MSSESKNNEIDSDTSMKDASACLEAFTKDGFKTMIKATRISNMLPSSRNWNFYKLDETFAKVVTEESDHVLHQINKILRKYKIEDSIRVRGMEEKMELMVEANDTILEKVSDNIDEMNGLKKNTIPPIEYQMVSAHLPINGSWNRPNKLKFTISNSINSPTNKTDMTQTIRLLTGKNIIRPQKFFKDKIYNSNTPWQPRITYKPNSIKPLALYLEETDFGEAFCHPYEMELDQFKPTTKQLTEIVPVLPLCITETPLYEISTPEKLEELLEELRRHDEIAVDLEHHSYRTFMGITCLMQISTRDADYLIDTLELRDKLHILNEVFTKPSIIKIFHGAESDIQWLQRDLSLYVVNMFDTYQAAKQLEYPSLSLSYLLNRFCKLNPNKQFQLADWRIRPLPEELKNYAREDTHYLIYIYHMLCIELINQGNGSDHILKTVIQKSTEICKKRYFKPILREDGYLDFCRKYKRQFNNRQMHALKGLYEWRDGKAREEDESIGYVLPNHMLLQIAEMLPREVQGILACCSPIPPLVRSNLLELHQIILHARNQSLIKTIITEDNRDRGSIPQFSKLSIDNPLCCPHDATRQQEFRDDLPTLLGNVLSEATTKEDACAVLNVKAEIEKTKGNFTLFETTDEDTNDENEVLQFLGPHERFKLVKPYIQALERKEAAAAAESVADSKPNQTDDKTNEDRIALLHQHFLKLSEETPQKLPEDGKNKQETAPEEYHPSLNTDPHSPRKRKSEHEYKQLSYHFEPNKKKRYEQKTSTAPEEYHSSLNRNPHRLRKIKQNQHEDKPSSYHFEPNKKKINEQETYTVPEEYNPYSPTKSEHEDEQPSYHFETNKKKRYEQKTSTAPEEYHSSLNRSPHRLRKIKQSEHEDKPSSYHFEPNKKKRYEQETYTVSEEYNPYSPTKSEHEDEQPSYHFETNKKKRYEQETYTVPKEHSSLNYNPHRPTKLKQSEHEDKPSSYHIETKKKKRNDFNVHNGRYVKQEKTLRNFGKAKEFNRQNYSRKMQNNESEFNSNSRFAVNQQNPHYYQNHNNNRYFAVGQNKNKNFKKFNKDNANKGSFSAFDYSSVDYGQFHGGASSSSGSATRVDSKFKQKNTNKMQGGKARNKSCTFKRRRDKRNF